MQWKAAISPHDDYKYAGRLYYKSLKGINANTIIFSGCCTSCSETYAQDKIILRLPIEMLMVILKCPI
jgi:hypothetical protein